jgi:hypothetical protein
VTKEHAAGGIPLGSVGMQFQVVAGSCMATPVTQEGSHLVFGGAVCSG